MSTKRLRVFGYHCPNSSLLALLALPLRPRTFGLLGTGWGGQYRNEATRAPTAALGPALGPSVDAQGYALGPNREALRMQARLTPASLAPRSNPQRFAMGSGDADSPPAAVERPSFDAFQAPLRQYPPAGHVGGWPGAPSTGGALPPQPLPTYLPKFGGLAPACAAQPGFGQPRYKQQAPAAASGQFQRPPGHQGFTSEIGNSERAHSVNGGPESSDFESECESDPGDPVASRIRAARVKKHWRMYREFTGTLTLNPVPDNAKGFKT